MGGGPAPGLNGVISAATIEGINQGFEVIGFRDGFKWLAAGDLQHYTKLTIADVKDIHLRGGSILGTARTNPGKNISHPSHLDDLALRAPLQRVYDGLRSLGVDALISIGGDDTLKTANKFKLFQDRLPAGSPRICRTVAIAVYEVPEVDG